MTTPHLRAGLYGRQSAGNAASVADQHRSNAAACVQRNWSETARYSDLVSASRFGKKTRDDWAKLGADVASGKLDIVVMWDLSRGDRTVASWAAFVDQCRERGVLIHATAHGRTYDPRVPRDWRTLMDDGVEAGFDSEQKSLVVRRGMAGAALAGKPHGSAGYGYTRQYDPYDRKVYVDVPDDRAPIVREIVERCAREEPLRHIVNDLNARGVPSPRGGLWTSRVVKQFATHPRYIGLRSHLGELHQGNWDPIVGEEVFRRAVAVLTAPNRKAAAPASNRYLLSYIGTAAPCGGFLNAQPDGEHRPARYRCNSDGCVSVRVNHLDELITRMTLERLALPDARGLFMPADAEASAAQVEVARLQARLVEARESFAGPEGISAAALASLERAVQPQLDAAQRRVAELTACAAGLELLGNGQFTVEVGTPRWRSLPLAGQRSVVKTLFEKIEVGPSVRRLSRWADREDHLLAVLERVTIERRSKVDS
ncbi:recombinase family protein [Lentzea sp. JNUCC 0626]|uniref:recombinase family protein n=1 Tax=Lentzea sp. JNUCC 0626 TaxID=3367513 RepID=UPI0037483E4B